MSAPAELHATYGWPPRLVMYLACAYTGRSRWTLARAARGGALPIAGRNGRSLVFDREALDRWMIGGCPTDARAGATEPAARPGNACPRSAGRTSAATSSALERLRVLRGGLR